MSWTAQVASSVDVAQILAAAGMGGTAAQTAQALFLPAAGPLDVIAELRSRSPSDVVDDSTPRSRPGGQFLLDDVPAETSGREKRLPCSIALRIWAERLVLSDPAIRPLVSETYTVSFLPLYAGLGVWLLAEVFRRGAVMRRDLEGLV